MMMMVILECWWKCSIPVGWLVGWLIRAGPSVRIHIRLDLSLSCDKGICLSVVVVVVVFVLC